MWLALDNKTLAMLFLTEESLLCGSFPGVSSWCIQMPSSLLLHSLKSKFFVHKWINKRSGQYFGALHFYLCSITLIQKCGTDTVAAVNHYVTTMMQSMYLCFERKHHCVVAFFILQVIALKNTYFFISHALNMKSKHHLSVNHNILFRIDSQWISLFYRKISVCI